MSSPVSVPVAYRLSVSVGLACAILAHPRTQKPVQQVKNVILLERPTQPNIIFTANASSYCKMHANSHYADKVAAAEISNDNLRLRRKFPAKRGLGFLNPVGGFKLGQNEFRQTDGRSTDLATTYPCFLLVRSLVDLSGQQSCNQHFSGFS